MRRAVVGVLRMPEMHSVAAREGLRPPRHTTPAGSETSGGVCGSSARGQCTTSQRRARAKLRQWRVARRGEGESPRINCVVAQVTPTVHCVVAQWWLSPAHNTPGCEFPKTRRAKKSSSLWKSHTASDLRRLSYTHIYSPTFSTAAAQLTRGCARAVHRPSTSSSTSAFECDETNSYCLPSVPDGVARRDVRSDLSDPSGMNKDDSASQASGGRQSRQHTAVSTS